MSDKLSIDELRALRFDPGMPAGTGTGQLIILAKHLVAVAIEQAEREQDIVRSIAQMARTQAGVLRTVVRDVIAEDSARSGSSTAADNDLGALIKLQNGIIADLRADVDRLRNRLEHAGVAA